MALKALPNWASSSSPLTGIRCDRSSEPNRVAASFNDSSGRVIERPSRRARSNATVEPRTSAARPASSCACSRRRSDEISSAT